MKRTRTAVILSLLAVLIVGTASISLYAASRRTGAPVRSQVAVTRATPPTDAQLLSLVNQQRAKVGVAPLKEDATLDKSAQWKANDMFANNYFGHVKPGTTGNDGLDYLNSLHPSCSYISENLAWNTDKSMIAASEAVDWWMTSTPHRAATLDPTYTLTGFGIVKDAVVEHFCRP